jgi:hypothetical protein
MKGDIYNSIALIRCVKALNFKNAPQLSNIRAKLVQFLNVHINSAQRAFTKTKSSGKLDHQCKLNQAQMHHQSEVKNPNNPSPRYYKFNSCLSNKYLDYRHI